MIGVLGRVVVLLAVYLLTVTSTAPGDILVGTVLAVGIVAGARTLRRPEPPPDGTSPIKRLAGVPALFGGTLVDMARGCWRVGRGCVRGRLPAPGLVTVPIGHRADSAAAWAIRVGLSPDSIVVEVDEERGELVLHVPDARDPDRVRREQLDTYERRQRRVFP